MKEPTISAVIGKVTPVGNAWEIALMPDNTTWLSVRPADCVAAGFKVPEVGDVVELVPPRIVGIRRALTLEDIHASHDCDPGRCVCICDCWTTMGCRTILGGLCSRCHLAYVRDDDEHERHGFPPESAPEARAEDQSTAGRGADHSEGKS